MIANSALGQGFAPCQHNGITCPRYFSSSSSRKSSLSSSVQRHRSRYTTNANPSNRERCSTGRRLAPAQAASTTPVTVQGADFDWRLGLALGGCSFEAYNGLDEGGDEHVKQVSLGGTMVTYVDPSFVQQKMAGLLEVTVVGASGLKPADWWPGSKADPYVQINVGGSSARTKTQKSTLSPSWGETFFIFVRNLSTQRLMIRVLDEDIADSDDLMGYAARGLADLGDCEPREIEVPLVGVAGTVTLRLQMDLFDDADSLREAAGSRMGGAVLGSPANALINSPWKELKDLLIPAEAAADAAFDPIAFLDNPQSDTQAWIFWNPENRTVVVAFRGTEQTKWKDVLTDLSLVPSSLDPEGVGANEEDGSQSPAAKGIDAIKAGLENQGNGLKAIISAGVRAATKKGEEPEWVHAGFRKAYTTIRADIYDILDTVLEGEKEPWTLLITGHSLGGALSTLCAYDCARRTKWPGPKPTVVNYSYGSPRVGNRVFAESFNALISNCWRVVNNNDAVTQVPRLMGYAHVGGSVQLTPEGIVAVQRDSVGSGVGEGANLTDLAAAMVTTALGSTDGGEEGGLLDTKEEVAAVLAAEMTAMESLLDGSAVAEHLEPLYLENLKTAVDRYFSLRGDKKN